MNSKVFELIDRQLEREPERSMLRLMARQLKDIIAATPGAAELVEQDLQNEAMSLKNLKLKFDAFASAHKNGGQAIITPDEGEEIIRGFYGIQGQGAAEPPRQAPRPKSMSFLDFL